MPKAPQYISITKYRAMKRQLRKLEAKNYDKIYLIPCNGESNWHEIAEHSALIYYYEVCLKTNSKTKFMADILSYYDEYEIGYLHTLGINHVRANLQKTGLYKTEEADGEIHIFHLNQSFTPAYIQALQQKEKERRLKNLTPVDAHNLDPELHQLLVMLATRLNNLCSNRFDKINRITSGVLIVNLANEMLANYHKLTTLKKASPNRLLRIFGAMRKDVYNLMVYVRVVGETRVIDLETIASLSESIFIIRDHIDSHIRKIQKSSKEVNNGTR